MTRRAAPFFWRRGFSIVSAVLILSWTVSACAGVVRVADPAATTGSAAPLSVEPQREWADTIVYFAIVDRFADGDPRNDFDVDRQGHVPRRGPGRPAPAARRPGRPGRDRDLDHAGGQEHRRLRHRRRLSGLGLSRLLGPTTSPPPTGASAASRSWPSSSRTATAAGSSSCSTWSTTTRATVRNT
jgi:hypothetical protein